MNNLVPLSDIEQMAEAVAQSKMFGVTTKQQAMSLMLIAQAEGMHPAKAAQEYHVIQGKPALKTDALQARFQREGGKIEWITYTDEIVSCKFSHPSGGELVVEWTMDRAKAAGLTGKQTWKQYPRQMLSARCLSEGIRKVYPGATGSFYVEEEVRDFDAKPNGTLKERILKNVNPAPYEHLDTYEARINEAESIDDLKLVGGDIKNDAALSADEKTSFRNMYRARLDEFQQVIHEGEIIDVEIEEVIDAE